MHGKPAKIRESAKHLTDFQGAFDRVGQRVRALDSGHWKGQAADAFRQKFAMHPTDWLHAEAHRVANETQATPSFHADHQPRAGGGTGRRGNRPARVRPPPEGTCPAGLARATGFRRP
ncbi:putative T7SS-secreted protein [Streptomyces sp. NPDC058049]|uniref:putative T7SS-secreted protein n=2 Tax=Streptomyces TaxID=1883 RepID=UPI0036EE1775